MTSIKNLLTLSVAFLFLHSGTVCAQIYFQQGNSQIRKADLNGSGLTPLITTTIKGPLSLDAPNGKMYWSDSSNIRRANLDGTGMEDVLTGQSLVREIAVDPSSSRFYWTDEGDGVVRRAKYDGSNVETLVSGLSSPYGVELDVPDGRMFYVDGSAAHVASLDGSGSSLLHDHGVGGIHSMAIAAADDLIFWAHTAPGPTSSIYKMNTDGSGLALILSGSATSSMRGMGIDLVNKKIYFDEGYGEVIMRANFDGSDLETVLGDAQAPSILPRVGVAVPEPSAGVFGVLALMLLAIVHRPSRS